MRAHLHRFPVRRLLSTTLALALTAGLGASVAGAQTSAPSPKAPGQCFFMKDWQSWKASDDYKTLYVRVGPSQVYKLDLTYACPDLNNIDARIVNRARGGTDSVCSPLDLDLSVYTPPGQSSPCMVKAMTPMSRDQVASLPAKQKP